VKRILSKLFDKALSFVEEIRPKEKVALIYDTDADGISSAALVLHAFKKMRKKISKTFPSSFEIVRSFNSVVKRFDKVVFVDVPTDFIDRYLIKTEGNLLVIDHHPGNDLNSKNILFINPRLENPEIYQPVAYVVYKIFERFIKDNKWVAKLGIVGDFGVDDCKDFVKVRNRKNIWKTVFGKAAMMTASAISVLGPEATLKILVASKNLNEFVRNRKIVLANKEFEMELKNKKDEFYKNLELKGKLMVSEISSRYKKTGAILVTMISTENPEKIVVLIEDIGKKYRIHGRNQSGLIHVGKLFKKICDGGGHRPSGAGTIKKEDIGKFKKRLLRELTDFTGEKS